jgi:hypothetical protein
MSLRYHKWLTLEITHSYFGPEGLNAYLVSPLESTQNLMKSYRIMARKNGNKIEFYIGLENGAALDLAAALEGLGFLSFKLESDDPSFFNYTHIDLPKENTTYVFRTIPGQNSLQKTSIPNDTENPEFIPLKPARFIVQLPAQASILEIKNEDGESIVQQAIDNETGQQVVIDLSLQEERLYQLLVNNEVQEQFFLVKGDFKRGSLGLIHLNISEILQNQVPELTYSLPFQARNVYWEYLIVPSPSNELTIHKMEVTGSSQETYIGPVESVLHQGKKALVFTSPTPLPLSHKLETHPKLELKYTDQFSNTPKDLIISLPSHDRNTIGRYQEGTNKGSYYSQAIVYI